MIFLIEISEKYGINPKDVSEIIPIKTATVSSEIRLFDDCDTENMEHWKECKEFRLSEGDIIIKKR